MASINIPYHTIRSTNSVVKSKLLMTICMLFVNVARFAAKSQQSSKYKNKSHQHCRLVCLNIMVDIGLMRSGWFLIHKWSITPVQNKCSALIQWLVNISYNTIAITVQTVTTVIYGRRSSLLNGHHLAWRLGLVFKNCTAVSNHLHDAASCRHVVRPSSPRAYT